MRLRSTLLALVFAALVANLGGCGSGPSSQDCDKLLDHIIDLEVDAAGAEAGKELDKQRKELKQGIKDEFMSQCLDDTPKAFVACALKKKSIDDLAKCDS